MAWHPSFDMSDWGWFTFLIFSAVGNLAVVIISLLPPPQAFPRIHVRESWRQARNAGGDDGNEHRVWAGITLFVPAFLNNWVNIPQKVIANDWGRGRLGYVDILLLLNNFLVLPLSLAYPTCAHTLYYMCFFFCALYIHIKEKHT